MRIAEDVALLDARIADSCLGAASDRGFHARLAIVACAQALSPRRQLQRGVSKRAAELQHNVALEHERARQRTEKGGLSNQQ